MTFWKNTSSKSKIDIKTSTNEGCGSSAFIGNFEQALAHLVINQHRRNHPFNTYAKFSEKLTFLTT